FGLWLDSTGTKGYLSSSRSGTDQVYALRVHPPVFAVEGTVTNAGTGTPMPGVRVALRELPNFDDATVTTDGDGNFRFELEPNSAYRIMATRGDMLAKSRFASTIGLGLSTVLRADLQLE